MVKNIGLTEINFDNLTLCKFTNKHYERQDHSRWVFECNDFNVFSTCNSLFVKIWNSNYVRRDNILKAIDTGFYDEITTPALVAIIFHKGLCRGYIMDKCNKNHGLILNNMFYSLLKDKTRDTGLFNAQFSPCHVMKYKNWFSLIDLEGVFHISELPDIHKYQAFFDYKDYESFVISEYIKTRPALNESFFTADMKNKKYFKNINPLLRMLQSITTNIWQKHRTSINMNTSLIEF